MSDTESWLNGCGTLDRQPFATSQATIKVQWDLYQAPELPVFDLVDELVAIEAFLTAVRASLDAVRFDLWFALRILDKKPTAVVDAGLCPWSLSTLYERIHDRFSDEMDAEICTSPCANWFGFDCELSGRVSPASSACSSDSSSTVSWLT